MSQTYIDDEDLTKVTYKGTWVRGGTASEYKGTVASSTVVGDSFTVSFQGSSIAVYGTIDAASGGVTTNYSIDGGATTQAVSQAGSGDTYNQQFWKSDTLQVGQHVLNVTMTKVNANSQAGEGTVWFDYFIVTDTTIVSSTGSTTLTSTSSTASTSSSATATNKKSNLPAILGGIIGGLVFLIVLFLLLCFWRYRKRKSTARKISQFKPDIDPDPSSPTSGHHISPFDPVSADIEPFPLGHRSVASIDNSSRYSSSTWAPALHQKSYLHHATNSVSTSSHANFSSDPSGFAESIVGSSVGRPTSAGASSKSRHMLRPPSEITVSSSLPPVQHVDSGMRSINMELLTSPPELPPVYSPI